MKLAKFLLLFLMVCILVGIIGMATESLVMVRAASILFPIALLCFIVVCVTMPLRKPHS